MDVLIADDDDISRDLLKNVLKRNGHKVIEAKNGLEAWQLYLAKRPPMVITDWIMPEMDGINLCQNIRGAAGEHYTYIVVLTSKDGIHDLVQGFDAGADDYITKPLNMDKLTARIKNGKRLLEYKTLLYGMQSELKKRNKELEGALAKMTMARYRMLASEKMASLGRLSAGLAHEINNPICFVHGNLKVLSGYVDEMAKLLYLYQRLIHMLDRKGIPISGNIKGQFKTLMETQEDVNAEYLIKQVPIILEHLTEKLGNVTSVIKKLRSLAIPASLSMNQENSVPLTTKEIGYDK